MSTSDFRSLQATFVPREEAPGQGRLYFWCMPPRRIDYARRALTTLGILRPGKSPPTGKLELVIPTPTRNKNEDWEIAELVGIRLPLVETVRGLVRMDVAEARRLRVSDSVRTWAMGAKLAVELIASGQIVPLLDKNADDKPYARWAVTTMTVETRQRIDKLHECMPIAGHCLVLDDGQNADSNRRRRRNRRRRKRKPVTEQTMVWSAESLMHQFLDAVADAMGREALPSTSKDRPRKDNRELAPWELRWRYALTAADPSFENAGLIEKPLVGEIERWSSPVRPQTTTGTAYSIAYQLEQPGSTAEASQVADAWYLRYLIVANDDPSVVVAASEIWESPEGCLQKGDRSFLQCRQSLLESLAETAKLFLPVARSLYGPQPAGVLLTTEEAWHFIANVGPILFQFGIGVRVPKELRADGQQRMRLKLHVGDSGFGDGFGEPSQVGLRDLANFHWQVALGEHDLSPEEFREIAALKQPLVQWRGQWMAVDPTELAEMERLFEGAESQGTMDRATALAAALSGSMTAGGTVGEIQVVAEGEILKLIGALRESQKSESLETPKDFLGELRPYQSVGLTWLAQMTDLGFGVCLADDMGLGKTIQVIVLLLRNMAEGLWTNEPALLICPTSVLGNWERELKRFAPSLRVIRHHGRSRASNDIEAKRFNQPNQVVLTTYVIARMDQKLLSKQNWSHLIIDEAQNIKNPAAQQALAIRAIPAQRRIALTGTPVENRLSELWSILEFANAGMLGPLSQFRRRFAVPIERFGDQKSAETLRRLVSPFILRRLKSDPNVIQDLPDKQEYKVYCTLTREQATLYQAAVDNALREIESSSGVKRRGNILALLTKLKQVCNHPAHLLKEGETAKLTGRSGKFTRMMEMMEEVMAENDHALIFTQYKEMGDLLVAHFRDNLDIDIPFIHGGVPARKRDTIVEHFQNAPDASPVLLLSLKAGGTGLNLTRATTVFHFDRWWNPAVEDQATDRAYRVGQTQNVQVHKMVCTGTIEEKIDDILESKRSLADQIVGSGEAWITEMNDTELRDLFSLSGGATIDDDDSEVAA